MKNTISWRNKFFSVGMIVFLMLFFTACTPGNGPSFHGVAPTITSSDNYTFTEGVAGTFTVTATGKPTPTFALTGDTLPSGITFDDSTGVLSGTPEAGTKGTYNLTITASNGVSPDATQSFTLNVITASTAFLIVTGASPYPKVVANITSIMTAAGKTVTTSVDVPGDDLSGYAQIWDVRHDTPLTNGHGDFYSYTTYLAGGGTVVVIGENTGFVTRNNSIVSLISNLGGGSITITGEDNATETVQSPFNSPNVITTVTYPTSAYAGNSGTGTFITKRTDTTGSALYFARGTLSNATAGRLMVVFDVNWMTTDYGSDFQNLIDNMVKLP